jgi:hypothetical protein
VYFLPVDTGGYEGYINGEENGYNYNCEIFLNVGIFKYIHVNIFQMRLFYSGRHIPIRYGMEIILYNIRANNL